MSSLSMMDLGFVITETAASPKHVAGLLIFDLPESDPGNTVGKVVDTMRAAPVRAPFNRVLKTGRYGLPEWQRITNVDTTHHIRHLRLPRPGSEAQLMDLVEQLHAPLLDRNRPLWEVHVIEGLENNRVALYTKLHHAYADGVTFSRWMVESMSTTPVQMDTVPPWAIQHLPDAGQITNEINPLEILRQLGRGALTLAELGTMTLRHGLQLTGSYDSQVPVPFAAPRTPFNGAPTSDRAVTVLSMELLELRDLARSVGASINDLVLTMVDMGLREYMRQHKIQTDKPLIAEMPVNLRRDSATEQTGNQISILLLELGDAKASPLERLAQIHAASRRVQRQFAALSEQTVTTYSLGTQIMAQIGEALNLNDTAPPLGNVVVSNVPGPQVPLYFYGTRLRGVFPISVLAPNVALNITVYSYAGRMCFGLVAGKRQIPDLPDLTRYIKDSLQVLKDAARKHTEPPQAAEKTKSPPLTKPAVIREKNLPADDKTAAHAPEVPAEKATLVRKKKHVVRKKTALPKTAAHAPEAPVPAVVSKPAARKKAVRKPVVLKKAAEEPAPEGSGS
ncbi:MAG: wax ester/triacylglycerol synthase family O-acyltransferase [Gammaproteobacteria bacterium]|nr:wax ester/triacylglycerol synthase family O-acyltransferase [Gammaproteobacteria bacterium]